MQKPRLSAIEYIRGISMMGVIGIHVGSQYILMNPTPNLHLTAWFEIVTRFSVPIFFFISAFGLFYHLDLQKPFDYRAFLKRRWRTVLIPYIIWSLFYVVHDGILYGTGLPDPFHFPYLLFFGLAKYQLYFLVILLWFYLLMPLWIAVVRRISLMGLALLLLAQIGFDYFSSYNVAFNTYVYGLPEGSPLRPFLMYRLNYWVLHYVFIFVLGGWLSVHFDAFRDFMQKRRLAVIAFFWLSLASLLGYYYYLIYGQGCTQEAAINTAHQLSPEGIFYTIAASLFFFTVFTYQKYPALLNPLLSLLGKHSYFAYLAHPIAIGYFSIWLTKHNYIMSAPLAIAYYFAVLFTSVLAAALCRKIGERIPVLNELTIGVYQKKKG